LVRRKPIEDFHAGDGDLRRVLGPVGLTALGVGAIIGSGIFVTTGEVAARHAGPGVVLAYGVAAVGCALAALCYAEFAALAPSAGSAYSYAYATLGELLAWVIGWDLVLEYAAAGAYVAVGWAAYLDEFLLALTGHRLPSVVTADPFSTGGRSVINLPAAVIMALVTIVLVRGVKESARANAVLVVVKVGVVLLVIAAGAALVTPSNWTGIPTEARHSADDPAASWGLLGWLGVHQSFGGVDEATRTPFLPFGASGVMLGAAMVFFAYLGFDTVSTHAEEARRPGRDLPIGILASLVICTVLYIGVAVVLTGMVPYHELDPKAAVVSAFARRGESGGWFPRSAAVLIGAGALAGMTSVLLVTFQGQARIFLAMARDGLLPRRVFAAVHPRFRTPYRSTVLTGTVVALVAAFTPAEELGNMVCIGTLMAFAIVCAAVLILRLTRPECERPFRCPWVSVVAPFGVFVNLGMMLFLPPATWVRLAVWLAVGLVVYFAYGRRHSVLHARAEGRVPAAEARPGEEPPCR
jgi:APA family basic amino acid/polyamine antiporter